MNYQPTSCCGSNLDVCVVESLIMLYLSAHDGGIVWKGEVLSYGSCHELLAIA